MEYQKSKYTFDPKSKFPFKLSRTKIELFKDCPRCFYLDRRCGVGRPPGFPFTLNAAVDALFKKEFDIHRAQNTAHPLMKAYKIDAVPFQHEKMDEWRENFKGVQFLHRPTNFLVFGAVDDLWINKKGELIVVDYKATSTSSEITLEAEYREAYKRQMEVYQWLLRQNEFKVSDTGYFVYANGDKDKEAFDAKLEFKIQIIPYEGKANWIEDTLEEARKCLIGNIPEANPKCEYCGYRKNAKTFEVPTPGTLF